MFAQVLSSLDGRPTWPAEAPHPADAVGLVLYFGARARLADGETHEALRRAFPGAVVCGCSTGGQIVGDGVVDEDVAAIGFAFDRTAVRLASEEIADPAGSRACGEALGRALADGDDLAGVFVLADGLSVNGNELVAGLVATLGDAIPITGGMACDGTAFERTLVAAGAPPRSNVVAALGFHGADFHMGFGIGAGWQVFGPRRRVTRSSGNRVYDVDGAPILELYRRYLGNEEFAGLPTTGLRFPLQIHHPQTPDETVVRAVLGVDHADGSMYFGGDIPVGTVVQLMRGTFGRLTAAAAGAARQVEDVVDAADADAAAAILVSCIGRRILMGCNVEDEVVAVAERLHDPMPRVGFYSLGEISPYPGTRRAALHNETMTIVTLSERAGPDHA